MKVTVAGHLEKVSGAHGDLVYVQLNNGTCYARQRPCKRHRRRTEDQVQAQAFTSRASANWNALTQGQRDGWYDVAVRQMLRDREGRRVRPNAVAMYVRANMTRQILGLPLLTDPPVAEAPGAISEMEAVPVDDPRAAAIRVYHRVTDPGEMADLVLLARMAPPPVTNARKFMPSDFRYICKMTPESARPLPTSGGVVTYSPTQFEIAPGKRYKIELRVARVSEGLVSDPKEQEFWKPL